LKREGESVERLSLQAFKLLYLIEMKNVFHSTVAIRVFPLDGNFGVSNIQLALDYIQSVQFGWPDWFWSMSSKMTQ